MEAGYAARVEDYKNKQDIDDGGKDIIAFFTGKIPEPDLYALKASVYIQRVFKEGKNVNNLKRDLRYKYGQRGANICNLYSAGYFKSWIIPLYESSISQNLFLDAYNLTVAQPLFAVFVNSQMTADQVAIQVKDQLTECSKYGIKTVNVHGIGTDNITNIIKAMDELKKEGKYQIEIETAGVFVARISLINK